jgi:hypothetical protein
MSETKVTFVASFDSPSISELSIDMEIFGGKVVSTYFGDAVEEMYELRDVNEQHERKIGIAQMYEITRSLKNQSMLSIVEGLYDAGYRAESN